MVPRCVCVRFLAYLQPSVASGFRILSYTRSEETDPKENDVVVPACPSSHDTSLMSVKLLNNLLENWEF